MIELISKSEGKPCKIVFDRKNEKKSVTITPQYDPATKRARIGIIFSTRRFYEDRTPDTLGAGQGRLRKNDRHFQRAGALQTDRRGRKRFGRAGVYPRHARQPGEQRLSPRVELPGAAQHQFAFINLLPIPVLDGGHILMAIIEKIRRRPLSIKFVEYTTTGFAVLLLSLHALHHGFWRHQTVCVLSRHVQKRRANPSNRPACRTPRRPSPNNSCATANRRSSISAARPAKSSSATRRAAGHHRRQPSRRDAIHAHLRHDGHRRSA